MKQSTEVNFALLEPLEAVELLSRCEPQSMRNKKVNIRVPANAGRIYIQEWQNFPLAERIQRLNVPWI